MSVYRQMMVDVYVGKTGSLVLSFCLRSITRLPRIPMGRCCSPMGLLVVLHQTLAARKGYD